MMEGTRIKAGDIVVGEEILWNVCDEHGKLLLRKGTVIRSQEQLEALLQRGMFIHMNARDEGEEAERERETVSPFDLIDDAQRRLERILGRIADEPEFPQRVLEICAMLQRAAEIDEEAALASILIGNVSRYSIRHSVHVALICETISKFQKVAEEERRPMVAAALTMNVAMLHLQDQLQHRREPLTQAQRDEIHRHPQRGAEMLRGAGVTDGLWLDGVLHHHESLDGSGYPGGLREGEISACAQLIHLADLYAARVSARDYRPGKPPSQALREIFLSRGQSVNATLAAVLIKELGVYPPGTFVRLANGELALAIRRGAAPDAPIVQSLVGPRGNLYVIPIRRDCGKPGLAVKEIVPQAEVDVKINRNLLWGYQPKSTRG